jgi:hypothetical protein
MGALTEDRFWHLPLDHPIEIEQRAHWLTTLGDVANFILDLPDTLKRHPSWQAATGVVLEAARSGDTAPVTMAIHMALMLSGQNARSVWNDGVDAADDPEHFPSLQLP